MGESAGVRGVGGSAGTARTTSVPLAPRAQLHPAPSRTSEKSLPQDESRGRRLTFAALGFLAAINIAGLPYYMLSSGERMRSTLHPWLKPTGYVGQAAGFMSFAMFLYMWLYPLRKKVRWLDFGGSLARWLDVHVAAGLIIPFLAAIHAAWHFTGLIGLGYGAMMVVCLSGIVGRYLYARIPRSRSGLELSIEEANAQRQALLQRIVTVTRLDQEVVDRLLSVDSLPYQGLGPARTVLRMLHDDFSRSRAARRLRRHWKKVSGHRTTADRAIFSEVLRLARRQVALGQQVRMLDATHNVFRYWHVAHKPFAITALVAVVLHVVTAIALGVTWIG